MKRAGFHLPVSVTPSYESYSGSSGQQRVQTDPGKLGGRKVGLVRWQGRLSQRLDVMKYLDTSWFEEAVPVSEGLDAVKPLLGYYFCWAAINDLMGQIHTENPEFAVDELKSRKSSPLSVLSVIGHELTDEDFNARGAAFSEDYLRAKYFQDFTTTFLYDAADSHPFEVPDSWQRFDELAERIEKRFAKWSAGEDINRPWWRFWG